VVGCQSGHAYINCDHYSLPTQINAHCYPVWASLARDYLAVMASSVVSERAFLSAGITILKCRNCLKGDIFEALQCLKCMIHHSLIFCSDPTVTIADEVAEEDDIAIDVGDNIAPNFADQASVTGWDDTWLDLEEVDMEG